MTQTSVLEVALARPVKHSNKFITKSPGLSVAEKATDATARIVGKRTHSASTGGSSMI
jgi:hypothetical protein